MGGLWRSSLPQCPLGETLPHSRQQSTSSVHRASSTPALQFAKGRLALGRSSTCELCKLASIASNCDWRQEGYEKAGHMDSNSKRQASARAARSGQPEQPGRPERLEAARQSGQLERPGRPERPQAANQNGQGSQSGQPERPGRPERPARAANASSRATSQSSQSSDAVVLDWSVLGRGSDMLAGCIIYNTLCGKPTPLTD